MRVEQQNTNIVDKLKQSIGPENPENRLLAEMSAKEAFFAGEKTEKTEHTESVNLRDATYLKPKAEEKKSALESYEQGSALDAAERKDQMVVLAGTTSAEDYAKMQESGFSLDETSSNTIVTETDKIKAQLAKAGVDISFFGDDLSMEELESIAGSPEAAAQIARAMQQADLPCTEENVRDAAEALNMAGTLGKPDAGAVKYLLDNGLPPTIENLYKAEHSSNKLPVSGTPVDMEALHGQVERVIGEAGLPVNDETLAESKWMVENNIPLNAENLEYVHRLHETALPADSGMLLEGIASAVAEGGRPQDALLLPGYSLSEQAEKAYDTLQQATDADLGYLTEHGMELTIKNLSHAIAAREAAAANGSVTEGGVAESYTQRGLALVTARRQLEEARLAMTAEANYALLKRGIQIDTQPLAKLVEELRAVENSYYENLLRGQGVEASGENVSVLRETAEKIADLKSAPAYVLGMREIRTATVDEVHTRAEEMREAFLRANERYETLMTAPRADLGDSIQKAFRNVDDILADLGVDATEANRRAVRILGYNELSVTPEHIAEVKAVDEEVQRTFRNLKPATVIEMIRRGINPLDMDFASVNEAAEQIAAENGSAEDSRKFGEFLWKLEHDHAISEEERDSYIGTYRLIHQVEQTDGAVIGALLHQGTDITMRNLMMAVRNARHSGKMDYTVDDSFGEKEQSSSLFGSITEQMETAYQKNCLKDAADILTPHRMKQLMRDEAAWEDLTPEQLKEALQQADGDAQERLADAAYAREQLARLTQSSNVTEDIYAVLEKYDMPNTVSNILAMEAMLRNRNGMFRQIFGNGTKEAEEEVGADDIEEMKQKVLDAFGEAIAAPEEMAEAQEKLGVLAENVMRGMIEKDDVTSIDVREMRLLSAQLSISNALTKHEQYSVPVMTGDGVVSVSLKIVRGVDKKGVVDITMESALRGKIAATFHAKEQGVTGLIAAESGETRELLEQHREELLEGLAGEQTADIHYAHIEDLDLNRFGSFAGSAGEKETLAGGEENYQVQTTRLYQIAETFIRQMREVL